MQTPQQLWLTLQRGLSHWKAGPRFEASKHFLFSVFVSMFGFVTFVCASYPILLMIVTTELSVLYRSKKFRLIELFIALKFCLGRDGRDGMPGPPGPAGNEHTFVYFFSLFLFVCMYICLYWRNFEYWR